MKKQINKYIKELEFDISVDHDLLIYLYGMDEKDWTKEEKEMETYLQANTIEKEKVIKRLKKMLK